MDEKENLTKTAQNSAQGAAMDLPNINNVAAGSAMPPMGASGAQSANAGSAQNEASSASSHPAAPQAQSAHAAPAPSTDAKPNAGQGMSSPQNNPVSTGTTASAPAQPKVADVTVAAANLVPAPTIASTLSTGVTIEALLEECVTRNASDLHLETGLPPVLRLDGVLVPLTTYPVLDPMTVKELVFSTLDEDQQKILMKDKEFDYSFVVFA